MFESNGVYHIYNRANGSENLFREEKNYYFFLDKYAQYIIPVAHTFAYCLMPNHFHLMIKVRSKPDLTGFENLSGLVTRQFSNLFNSYTKAFNKCYERHGNLFQRPFKCKQVGDDAYFTHLLLYIHNNPVHHGFVKEMTDWPHSSIHYYLNDPFSFKNRQLLETTREEVIDWFGSISQLANEHEDVKQLRSVFD